MVLMSSTVTELVVQTSLHANPVSVHCLSMFVTAIMIVRMEVTNGIVRIEHVNRRNSNVQVESVFLEPMFAMVRTIVHLERTRKIVQTKQQLCYHLPQHLPP